MKPSPSPTPSGRTLKPRSSLQALRPASPQKSPSKRIKPLTEEPPVSPKAPSLSIREQIALKRAEAKKAQTQNTPKSALDDLAGLEEALPTQKASANEDMVDLGRWSVKETIERGRSTGTVGLASRGLPCIPSALFEIHLGITPEPLKLVPEEPPITTGTADDVSASRKRGGDSNGPSWYEAQDLTVLKAWSNEILEIQPEISLFGSLKTIDLHNNKLQALPSSFADLTSLTVLDISHNSLSSLPPNIFALPSLITLNLSHNNLTSLPFFVPFSDSVNPFGRTRDPRGEWFSETITRATTVLPKLVNLDVSHNKLTAASIDHENGHLPAALTKLDLSSNPLGLSTSLIRSLSRITRLSELRCERADIGDDSFPVTLFGSGSNPFPSLSVFDLGETHVTRPAIEASFLPGTVSKTVDFDVTTEEPRPGVLRIIVGKRVIKEAWEIEAERRTKARGRHLQQTSEELNSPLVGDTSTDNSKKEAVRELWGIEAEQGLLTEGAKRRAKATAAASNATGGTPTSQSKPTRLTTDVVAKEQWELEAEQGLLTAGGRRRARAAAATAAAQQSAPSKTPNPPPESSPSPSPAPSTGSALANPQYYVTATETLTLPPSVAVQKNQHFRSFSLAIKTSPLSSSASDLALAIPTPTLPLASIVSQPFSQTLKVLVLTNRKMDSSFNLPTESDGPFLPALEELVLEGCNLGNSVLVSRSAEPGGTDASSARASEALLPLLARLFPSLRTLDLSYNALTSDALARDALTALILASADGLEPHRPGLRVLRLRGNRLAGLDGFQELAGMFKGNRDVKEWKLEELDIRDNAIGRLPVEMGLLPMDVFLVDGNIFRVPPRRVWEREGTKGLLSWLRGRVE
ncbi:hypothetical protein PHLGIDRAFT_107207 [Phlebiopsis gigantea 11061_1 CR5-6]|uniref:L domain-like protein n=1 Tax=Phlebiopsis gigantea (strain 11061_1 CR5-6) TaxID=745531 RepID=A0A0C3S6L3_PHLG1|nr:hypothetical protein PHLGIDRAFT_107207 [Phlebiopsis gigantea 11061_1 CR5-6]